MNTHRQTLAAVAAARTEAFVATRRAEMAARDRVTGRTPEQALADLSAALDRELRTRAAA